MLDAEPEVVLCHSRWARIDEHKAVVTTSEKLPDYEQAGACNRFGSLIHMDQRQHSGVEIFGLIRMSALKRINQPPIGNFAHGDRLTLVALCLMGRFHRLPDPLLLSRTHEGRSMVFDPGRTWRGHTMTGQRLGIGPILPTNGSTRSGKGGSPFLTGGSCWNTGGHLTRRPCRQRNACAAACTSPAGPSPARRDWSAMS